MKKFALAIAATLALTACGDKSAETVNVSNDIVLNEEGVVSENLTAVDTLNATDAAIDNAAADTLNAADTAGNAVANTL